MLSETDDLYKTSHLKVIESKCILSLPEPSCGLPKVATGPADGGHLQFTRIWVAGSHSKRQFHQEPTVMAILSNNA